MFIRGKLHNVTSATAQPNLCTHTDSHILTHIHYRLDKRDRKWIVRGGTQIRTTINATYFWSFEPDHQKKFAVLGNFCES